MHKIKFPALFNQAAVDDFFSGMVDETVENYRIYNAIHTAKMLQLPLVADFLTDMLGYAAKDTEALITTLLELSIQPCVRRIHTELKKKYGEDFYLSCSVYL